MTVPSMCKRTVGVTVAEHTSYLRGFVSRKSATYRRDKKAFVWMCVCVLTESLHIRRYSL